MYIDALPYGIEIRKKGIIVYRYSTIDEESAKKALLRLKKIYGNDGYTAILTKDYEKKEIKF